MINFTYAKAGTQQAAISAMGKDAKAKFIAGGTNLLDLMKRNIMNPEKLVDINTVPLDTVERRDNIMYIGALALNSAVAEHPLVEKHLPLLSQAFLSGASAQIRNMATVGGNALQRTRCPYFYDTALPCNKRESGTGCGALNGYNRMHAIFGASEKCIAVHPSDMCVALAALDAVVVVAGPKGVRRIPLLQFHRLPGANPEQDTVLGRDELITAMEVPLNDALAKRSLYTKVRDRASYAFALVSVAAAMNVKGKTVQEVRLAMGGVAHKPWRLTEAEAFLRGKEATEANFRQAAVLAMNGAKGYGQNNFKLKLAPNTLVHTLQQLARG